MEDELCRDTTAVDVVLGDKKLRNDQTVSGIGLSSGSRVSAVLRQNVVRCQRKNELRPDLETEALVIIEIPESATEVEAFAFAGCDRVAKVAIPSSVTCIQNHAFYACRSLVTISMPDSLTSIGYNAFWGCVALTSVLIPDSVARIGDAAFQHCSLLTLTAPARLLQPEIGKDIKMVTLESGTEPDRQPKRPESGENGGELAVRTGKPCPSGCLPSLANAPWCCISLR